MTDPNPLVRGLYERNDDTNRDGDCLDMGEQRAFRVRVYPVQFEGTAGTDCACDAPIENEANNGLKNKNYTVAMARTGDPHSATAQFFINISNNDFLNHTSPNGSGWGYAVFGAVTAGQDVVDKIGAVRTARNGGHDDWPVEAVEIISATVA